MLAHAQLPPDPIPTILPVQEPVAAVLLRPLELELLDEHDEIDPDAPVDRELVEHGAVDVDRWGAWNAPA
eukprot:5284956-Pyramimonas_sp.AAC.1